MLMCEKNLRDPSINNTFKPIMPSLTLANSVVPDQMPQNVASDRGLHCLHLGQELL